MKEKPFKMKNINGLIICDNKSKKLKLMKHFLQMFERFCVSV